MGKILISLSVSKNANNSSIDAIISLELNVLDP